MKAGGELPSLEVLRDVPESQEERIERDSPQVRRGGEGEMESQEERIESDTPRVIGERR